MAKKRSDREVAERYKRLASREFTNEMLNLAVNSVVIDDAEKVTNAPTDIIVGMLLQYGRIGVYDGVVFKASSAGGRDTYNLPTAWNLTTLNGKSAIVPAHMCAIIKANAGATPLVPLIDLYARQYAEIETSIRTNILSTRTSTLLAANNPAVFEALESAYEDVTAGSPVTACLKDDFLGEIKAYNTAAPYYADRLNELKKEYRDELLTRLGIMTANSNKRERVQSAEVNATVGEALDCIYTMIDTFNRDSKRAGLPWRMRLNNVTEYLYAGDNEGGFE